MSLASSTAALASDFIKSDENYGFNYFLPLKVGDLDMGNFTLSLITDRADGAPCLILL
jgi:hypothetical protein